MDSYTDYKLMESNGITAIIIKGRKVLIFKRIWFPFMVHPGIWTFVAGKKERSETYEETAYREVREETGMDKTVLKQIATYDRVAKINPAKKRKHHDALYVFSSKTDKVRLNFENTSYRWASLSDIEDQREYTNIFADKGFIERVIRSAINGKKLASK